MSSPLEQACCAHLTVTYRTHDNGDGTVSGYWSCNTCTHEFHPAALDAEPEAAAPFHEIELQDAREWIDAMNVVKAKCERDLLAAYCAGQANASEDDAPDFQAWMDVRKGAEPKRALSSMSIETECRLAEAWVRGLEASKFPQWMAAKALSVHLGAIRALAEAKSVGPCCADMGPTKYMCTLPDGHAGDHEAWGSDADGVLDRWRAASPPPPSGDLAEQLEKAQFSARQFCGAHIGQSFERCPACPPEPSGDLAELAIFLGHVAEVVSDTTTRAGLVAAAHQLRAHRCNGLSEEDREYLLNHAAYCADSSVRARLRAIAGRKEENDV